MPSLLMVSLPPERQAKPLNQSLRFLYFYIFLSFHNPLIGQIQVALNKLSHRMQRLAPKQGPTQTQEF